MFIISYFVFLHLHVCMFSSVTSILVTSLSEMSSCRNTNVRRRYRNMRCRQLWVSVTSWHVHKQVSQSCWTFIQTC